MPLAFTPRDARCLLNTDAILVGNSETLNFAAWLQGVLQCSQNGTVPQERFNLRLCSKLVRNRSDFRASALCKEELYSRSPFTAACPRLNFNFSFVWKSRMLSEYDELLRQRLVASSDSRERRPLTILLLGGGPAHFALRDDYPRGLSSAVADNFSWPQAWIDDYVNATSALFELFAPRSLPRHVCVLWKSMHIGPRHNGSASHHHPSTINGAHHWINRLTSALAARAGIGSIDLTDLLSGMRPTGFRPADELGRFGHEGDPYHGFLAGAYMPQLVRRMCAACAGRGVDQAVVRQARLPLLR